MNRVEKTAIWAVSITLAAFASWGLSGFTKHTIEAIDTIKDTARQAQPVLGNVAAVTNDVRSTSKAQSESLLEIERDVRVEMWDLNRTLLSTRGMIQEAQGTIGEARTTLTHVNGTADAATGLLASTNTAVKTNSSDFSRNLLLLEQSQTSMKTTIDDFDVILKSPALSDSFVQVDSNLTSFARISKKAADDFTLPQPWWRKVGRYAGDAADFGALLSRHTP